MNARQKKRVEKWVAALRSDDYKQGENYLKQETEGETTHCCLGVACELYIKSGNKLDYQEPDPVYDNAAYFGGDSEHLPEQVRNYYGLRTDYGEFIYSDGRRSSLTMANDGGKSFKQIANIIERNPKGLFL